MITKFGWDKNVRCAVGDQMKGPFQVVKMDRFASKMPQDCRLDEAISGYNILANKVGKGTRKALLKNAMTYLQDIDGMALYVLEAGKPKNFYSRGNLSFLPASLPESGMYMSGNKVYLFDPEQIFSNAYTISSASERDILYSPITSVDPITGLERQLGMLIAESAPGKKLTFRCCNSCDGLGEENKVSILLHYISQVSATYGHFLSGFFDDGTDVFNRKAYVREIEPSMYRWLEKIRETKNRLATAEKDSDSYKAVAEELKRLRFSVIYLDLNNFKKINDSFGHHAGDEALRQAAEIIVKCTKSSLIEWVSGSLPDINQIKNPDLVVRWGGDEFLVVLRDADADAAVSVGRRIINALAKTEYRGIHMGASMGIMDSEQLQEWISKNKDLGLLDRPDSLMYSAKKTRGDADGALARMMPDGSVRIDVCSGAGDGESTTVTIERTGYKGGS